MIDSHGLRRLQEPSVHHPLVRYVTQAQFVSMTMVFLLLPGLQARTVIVDRMRPPIEGGASG